MLKWLCRVGIHRWKLVMQQYATEFRHCEYCPVSEVRILSSDALSLYRWQRMRYRRLIDARVTD
jgi:hypothetical protein